MSKMWRLMVALAAADVLVGGLACASSAPTPTPAPGVDSIQVAYGSQPKEKMTGASTTLSGEDFSTRPMRLEEILRGKVPGLIVSGSGSTLTLRLRNTSSNEAAQDPLVVVDDVMIQSGNLANALSGLTAQDIKSVTVLKDVASTSLYGLRGGAGVILIKTTKGDRKDKPA